MIKRSDNSSFNHEPRQEPQDGRRRDSEPWVEASSADKISYVSASGQKCSMSKIDELHYTEDDHEARRNHEQNCGSRQNVKR
jgi:hypothetical protein